MDYLLSRSRLLGNPAPEQQPHALDGRDEDGGLDAVHDLQAAAGLRGGGEPGGQGKNHQVIQSRMFDGEVV